MKKYNEFYAMLFILVLGGFQNCIQAQFQNNGSSYLYTNKDVGIGTSTPIRPFQIRTNDHIAAEFTSKNSIGHPSVFGIRFDVTYNGGQRWDIGAASRGSSYGFVIKDATANEPRLVINKFGRVGIGTTLPTTTLHVKTTTAFPLRLEATNVYGTRIWLNPTATGGRSWHIGATANGAPEGGGRFIIKDGVSYNTHFTIDQTGHIGIGTNNPVYKLEVCGKIRAKEILVQSGWCDFVFEPNYKLPTLKEEANCIAEKGHLLGFKSEKEMNNHIQLADVSKRQQMKIEEIMLHLIDMKKEIENLKAENHQLKTLVNHLNK